MINLPAVLQATTFKVYTPSTDILPWEYTTFYLTTDANVTFIDYDGNSNTTVPLKAGYQPVLVRVISVVSAGAVYIMRHSKLSRE